MKGRRNERKGKERKGKGKGKKSPFAKKRLQKEQSPLYINLQLVRIWEIVNSSLSLSKWGQTRVGASGSSFFFGLFVGQVPRLRPLTVLDNLKCPPAQLPETTFFLFGGSIFFFSPGLRSRGPTQTLVLSPSL